MNKRHFIIYLIDILILVMSYLVVAIYKSNTLNYFSSHYLMAFFFLIILWSISSFYFKKYRLKKKHKFSRILQNILLPNFISLGVMTVIIVGLQLPNFSRLILFGTTALATFGELFLGNIYYLLLHSGTNGVNVINPPPTAAEMKKAKEAKDFMGHALTPDIIMEEVESACGKDAYEFMDEYADMHSKETLIISTTTRFNIEFQPDNYYTSIINLRRLNDIQYMNKFLESVNRKLPANGIFIGCVETSDARKKRILNKYPPLINRIIYFFDVIVKRVFPKFRLTKKIYFLFTRGMNRVISKVEVLGRLYSCGFEICDERVINNMFIFIVNKTGVPAYDFSPTYGPFVKLRRVGKDGKMIRVYKLRTMHPFAEYLQGYVYEVNKLEDGGKFKDDFRVSPLGRFLRKFWLDELPMFFNVLKGDMKLVGVRPLSQQYFDLYKEELKQKRILFKPGLIPPFYADMPETLEEIEDSEMRYLEAYEEHPLKTDWKYFWKAMYNIVFRKARSR